MMLQTCRGAGRVSIGAGEVPTRIPLPADRRGGSPPPLPDVSALFLSETVEGLNEGADFLSRLSDAELERVRASGRTFRVEAGALIFAQGDAHEGIFIIESGKVRVFYTAPSGREITLAYWTPGHFIGGPEISGSGSHIWSGVALEDCTLTVLPSAALKLLITGMPSFALCLVDALAAKGRCYSAMAQMLGTRSVIERLAQHLLNLAALFGVEDGRAVTITRKVTHEQLAAMVGSTRQWVTLTLKRFQKNGILSTDGRYLRIERPDLLSAIVLEDKAGRGS